MPNPWTGKGNPYTREEVIARLRAVTAKGDAIIAAGSDITGELVEVDRDGTVRFRRYPDPLGND
jgi:hypothetical protein